MNKTHSGLCGKLSRLPISTDFRDRVPASKCFQRTTLVASTPPPFPLVPARSLPAVAGCKRYPSVFCILRFGRGVREARHVGGSVTCGSSYGCGYSGGRSAREFPLHSLTRVLDPLWRLTRHRCIVVSSIATQYPRQLLTHAPLPACISTVFPAQERGHRARVGLCGGRGVFVGCALR